MLEAPSGVSLDRRSQSKRSLLFGRGRLRAESRRCRTRATVSAGLSGPGRPPCLIAARTRQYSRGVTRCAEAAGTGARGVIAGARFCGSLCRLNRPLVIIVNLLFVPFLPPPPPLPRPLPVPCPSKTPETLCKGLPALAEYLCYMQSLPPDKPVDYDRAEGIFHEGMRRRGFAPNAPFDWMNAHLHLGAAGAAAAAAAGNRGALGGGPRGNAMPPEVRARTIAVGAAVGGDGDVACPAATKRPKLGDPAPPAAAGVVRAPDTSLRGQAGLGESGTGGAEGVRVSASGSGSRACSAGTARAGPAALDLYADVPPPGKESLLATSAKARDALAGSSVLPSSGRASGKPVAVERGTDVKIPGGSAGDAGAEPTLEGASARGTAVRDARRGETPGGGNRSGSGGGSGSGAAHVDVSLALAKLRPHLARGSVTASTGSGGVSKKFPRACSLLADLLSAKMDADNEEMFFDVLCEAVRVDDGGGGGGGAGLRAEGPAGASVRRLLVAACASSGLFSPARQERVEAWGREAREVDARERRER